MQPGFLSIVDPKPPKIVPPAGLESTGRRTALANWLVSPENPLTARVMVNRIWMHHFGEGIVASPSDFGLIGSRPTHPELLDWLASEFVRTGWDIKAMQKLMVDFGSIKAPIPVSDLWDPQFVKAAGVKQ